MKEVNKIRRMTRDGEIIEIKYTKTFERLEGDMWRSTVELDKADFEMFAGIHVDDIVSTLMPTCDNGPGRSFAGTPTVEESGSKLIVTQLGGMDV